MALGWALWCLALAAGLWAGCALVPWLRFGLAALMLPVGGLGARHLRRGAGAARLVWEADGRWRLQGGSHPGSYVEPDPPRRLGPILWISWRGGRGAGYLHADGIRVEPIALRALKGRMRLAEPVGHRRSP